MSGRACISRHTQSGTGQEASASNRLQDYIDEATHEPWPGERTPPQAYAEVRDAVLHLWYGEPGASDQVVLGCAPVALADIKAHR